MAYNDELKAAIISTANERGWDPVDLATIMSYETGGTFDPWKKGPTTKWGEHRGLIQWGEPQRQKYNVNQSTSVTDQVSAAGQYLVDRGAKPGENILGLYAAINGGHVSKTEVTDENNGGAPGTVRDKVNNQMSGHRAKATKLLGGQYETADYRTPIFGDEGSDYAGWEAPDPYTEREIYDNPMETQNPTGYDTYGEAIMASSQVDHVGPWAQAQLGTGAVDPNWQLSLDEWHERAKEVPEEMHEYVLDAYSRDDFEGRIKHSSDVMKIEQKFADSGWGITATRFLTAGFDPAAIGLSIATEGALGPYLAAIKLTRMGRIAMGGLAIGGENAAFEAASSIVNPTIDGTDVAAAFGMGAFLGGSVGALRHNPATQVEAEQIATAGRNQIEASATQQTEGVQQQRGVGAGRVNSEELFDMDRPFLEQLDAPDAAFGNARLDSVGQLGSSKSALSRFFGGFFGEEGTGYKGGGVVPEAHTQKQQNINAKQWHIWQTRAYPAFDEWLKETGDWGKGKAFRKQAWDNFNEQITDWVEDPMPAPDVSVNIQAGGKAMREVLANYNDLLQNPLLEQGGIGRSIMNAPKDPYFVPKIPDHAKLNARIETFGLATVRDMVEGAWKSKIPTMKNKLAKRLAKGYLDSLLKAGAGMEDGVAVAIAKGDLDGMKKSLEGFLDDADIEEVHKMLDLKHGPKKAGSASGGSRHQKRRSNLDYRYKVQARAKSGQFEHLGMRDLFVSDANHLLHNYSRVASGQISLAQMQIKHPKTGELMFDGILNVAEFEKFKNWIRADHMEMPNMTHEQKKKNANKDISNFEYLYDSIAGKPHYKTREQLFVNMKRVQKFNFTRLMNLMGITQAQEFARPFGALGGRVMMQHIPALKRVVDNAGKNIPEDDTLLQELEMMLGKGTERDFNEFDHAYQADEIGTSSYGKTGRNIDGVLNKTNKLTSDWSLMTFVHSTQQKWVMKAVAQHLYNFAKKASDGVGGHNLSKLSNMELKKLRTVGLGADDLKGIFNLLSTHGSTVEGSKLTRLNLENWDPELRAKFLGTLNRMTNRMIHVNDPGNMSRWMSQPVVSMMMQFRTFLFGSWGKSMLYNLQHFDARTFGTMMLEAMVGGATWSLIQAAKHGWSDDGREKLKERLTPGNVFLAGIARTGWASFAPAIVDTGMTIVGEKPIFDYRSSGSKSDLIFGSPTIGLMDTAGDFIAGASKAALNGRAPTQRTMKDGVSLLPGGNYLPFTAVFSWMISDMEPGAKDDKTIGSMLGFTD